MGVKVRERPGKGWYVLIDWKGQRKSKCFGKNKKEAKRFADKLTHKLKWAEENGESISLSRPDQEMPTVEEYLVDWLHTHAKVNCKMSTYEGYEQIIRVQLIPTFGSRVLNTLKREDIARFISYWAEKGKSRSTIRNYLAPLKTVYSQAVGDGLVTINPVIQASRTFKTQGKRKHLVQPLTRDEASTLLSTGKDTYPGLYPLLLCALRTGCRLGEVIGLQWGDVDFHGSCIEIRRAIVRGRETTPKNHKPRRVDMSQQLWDVLKEVKELRQLEAMAKGVSLPEWVFLSPMGFRWDARNLRRCWERCLESSGLRHVRFHDLRHTYASHLIDLDVHAKYIQEQLGHSSIQVTMDIYGHLFPNRNKGWVNRLDEGSFEANSATPPQPGMEIPEEMRLSA